ncbi:hypothetical protein EON83_10510 [bacterium]|nr:MAG: hypothetical protein EON83_10510 [bacterium]
MNHFTEPSNEAVTTMKSILEGSAHILYVVNNEEGWQFLSGANAQTAEAQVVALERVINADPSIGELGNLPEGWHAWRATPASLWSRAPYDAG